MTNRDPSGVHLRGAADDLVAMKTIGLAAVLVALATPAWALNDDIEDIVSKSAPINRHLPHSPSTLRFVSLTALDHGRERKLPMP
jgi:hypothetical protein